MVPKTTTELHHQGSFCLFFGYCRCQSQEPAIIPGLLYLREFREAREVTPAYLSLPLEVVWQDTGISGSAAAQSQSLHHCAQQKAKVARCSPSRSQRSGPDCRWLLGPSPREVLGTVTFSFPASAACAERSRCQRSSPISSKKGRGLGVLVPLFGAQRERLGFITERRWREPLKKNPYGWVL